MRLVADQAHAFHPRRRGRSCTAALVTVVICSALSASAMPEDHRKARDYYSSQIPRRAGELPLVGIPSEFPGLYEIVFGRLRPGELLRSTYGGIRDVCLEISAALTPEETLYMSLGRSADVFALLLRELYGRGTGMYLPATSIRQMPTREFGGRRVGTTHIKQMLPTRKQLAGRKIALLDFVDTGGSLMIGAGLIRRAYASSRQERLVIPIALCDKNPGAVSSKLEPLDRVDNLRRSKMASITLPDALSHAMGHSQQYFKPWAAFLPHYLWSSTTAPCPNPLHRTFRHALQGFIKRDLELGWVDDPQHRSRKVELDHRLAGTTDARLPRRNARCLARQLFIVLSRRLPKRWTE